MSKKTLKAVTPFGEFNRTTGSNYTHIVVWHCPRAHKVFQLAVAGDTNDGVDARWIKDQGYGVTWHGSVAAAAKAAKGHYVYDLSSKVAGIFEVAA
jgi:hypothetical protein